MSLDLPGKTGKKVLGALLALVGIMIMPGPGQTAGKPGWMYCRTG